MLLRAVHCECNLTYNFCYKIKNYESDDELQGIKIWKWLLSLTQFYSILKHVEFPGFLQKKALKGLRSSVRDNFIGSIFLKKLF